MRILAKEKLLDVNLRFTDYMNIDKLIFVTDKAINPIRIKYIFSSYP